MKYVLNAKDPEAQAIFKKQEQISAKITELENTIKDSRSKYPQNIPELNQIGDLQGEIAKLHVELTQLFEVIE